MTFFTSSCEEVGCASFPDFKQYKPLLVPDPQRSVARLTDASRHPPRALHFWQTPKAGEPVDQQRLTEVGRDLGAALLHALQHAIDLVGAEVVHYHHVAWFQLRT